MYDFHFPYSLYLINVNIRSRIQEKTAEFKTELYPNINDFGLYTLTTISCHYSAFELTDRLLFLCDRTMSNILLVYSCNDRNIGKIT
jgi:hypothetical protein